MATGEQPLMMVDTRIELREDGTQCARLVNVPGAPDSPEGRQNQAYAQVQLAELGPCPNDPADPELEITPEGAAEYAWMELVDLPAPQAWVAPGEAITGLTAYMDIDGDRAPRYSFGPEEALGFAITITTSSTYDIDWGDRTVVTDVDSQGGAYPIGDIRHVYRSTKEDNVVKVTQRWDATWTATGNGQTVRGAVTTPLSTETTLALPVREIQAVRNY